MELFGYGEGAVGGAVVDDYDLPVEFARLRQGLDGIVGRGGGERKVVYFSVKVRARSQVIIGRLRRSL